MNRNRICPYLCDSGCTLFVYLGNYVILAETSYYRLIFHILKMRTNYIINPVDIIYDSTILVSFFVPRSGYLLQYELRNTLILMEFLSRNSPLQGILSDW